MCFNPSVSKYIHVVKNMAFKPNLDLLNAKFDGYKLSETPLSHLSTELASRVRVAHLTPEQFSYQHVRAFSLHNHLAKSPWDESSAFWCTEEYVIHRATYKQVDTAVSISCVYSAVSKPEGVSDAVAINPSICFIIEGCCLFSTGIGAIQLLSCCCSEQWRLRATLLPPELAGSCFAILAHQLSGDGLQLDLVTIDLKDPQQSEGVGEVAVYRWHRVTFENDIRLNDTDGVTVSSIRRLAMFQSRSITQYTGFSSSNLLMINEEDLLSPAEQTVTDPPAQEETSTVEKASEAAVETDENEDQKEAKHFGLGYSGADYKWEQSDSDVTITMEVPADVSKCDIVCEISSEELVVGLSDGTTYLRGRLHAKIDPEASTWSISKTLLEVVLEKKQGNVEWPLVLQEGAGSSSLPLHEGVDHTHLSTEELEDIERRIKEASGGGDEQNGDPAPKRVKTVVQNTLEECDTSDEDATLFVISGEDGSIVKKVGLGGRQIVFTAQGPPSSPDLFSLRHDVDAVVWQPSCKPDPLLNHIGTFNALGYVQAAKRDRKFTTCSPDLRFAAISDCNKHIFVYMQPPDGQQGLSALQYIHTLTTSGEILGLQASNAGILFVLCDRKLVVLTIQ